MEFLSSDRVSDLVLYLSVPSMQRSGRGVANSSGRWGQVYSDAVVSRGGEAKGAIVLAWAPRRRSGIVSRLLPIPSSRPFPFGCFNNRPFLRHPAATSFCAGEPAVSPTNAPTPNSLRAEVTCMSGTCVS